MKVTVVGAGGNVGSTVALSVAQRDFAKEVIALDLERKQDDKTFYPSKGRALDQWEASPIHLFDTRVKGTTDYADTAGSDVCVITAGGAPRAGGRGGREKKTRSWTAWKAPGPNQAAGPPRE